jgi:hypothetical protein
MAEFLSYKPIPFNIFNMFSKLPPPAQQNLILTNMNLSYNFTTTCYLIPISMY